MIVIHIYRYTINMYHVNDSAERGLVFSKYGFLKTNFGGSQINEIDL